MTDFKHFKVLHKHSNIIISIFRFTTDASWKGKEREKLIAIPADTPKNINEIQMCFTKQFKRYEGTDKEQDVTAFFKRKSGQPETLSERRVGGESEVHKLAKNEIYEKLYNKELTINGKTIYELGTKDLNISEEKISETGHSIADVLIQFKKYPNHHPLYDLGIDIELQFSTQNESRTKERTLSRLRDGWSVIWLWKDDFDINGKLKIKDLKVMPREKQLKRLKEKEYEDFLGKMNEIGNLIDNKIKFGKEEIKEEMKKSRKLINHISEDKINEIKEEVVTIHIEKVDEEFKKLINKEKVISKITSLFGDEIINNITKEIRENVKGEIEQGINKLNTDGEYIVRNFLKKMSEEYNSCFNGLDKIDYNKLRGELLNKLSNDKSLFNDFGDIFLRLKNDKLMKKVEDSFPLYVRDFFMSHFDDFLIKIYEDKFEDIKKTLDSIKVEKDLYEPKERGLVSQKFPTKEYPNKEIQLKIKDKNEKKDS